MSTRVHDEGLGHSELGKADSGFLLVLVVLAVFVAAPLVTLWLG